MEPHIIPVPEGRASFLGLPRIERLDDLEAEIAIIALPYNTPYSLEWGRGPSSFAPGAIRERSGGAIGMGDWLTSHYDFDFGGDLFGGRKVRMVDAGDVFEKPGQYEFNGEMATAVIKKIRERGAIPFTLGGDHATTIPIMRGFEGSPSMCAVHLDAHLDWRDEVNGVHDGLSSPMRRASELPWVNTMFQVGLRGVGSARQQEVDDSGKFGSVRIRAEDLRHRGVEAVLEEVPGADCYYISLDTDVMDPAVAPGINAMAFGGIDYFEATNLLKGIAAKGPVAGFDIVEIAPNVDVHNRTSLLAVRLILNLLGAMARSGQIGR
jgi:agmatinase